MKWYIVIFNLNNNPTGFILDNNVEAASFGSEEEAEKSMEGHILEHSVVYIEL